MIKNKKIAVVVPSFNEEKRITQVVTTMPSFVDHIIIVDDKSTDKTSKIVKDLSHKNNKIILKIHPKNQGVGAAIVTGYEEAVKQKDDVIAVMAGDAQMDPAELKDLCLPIALNEAEYVKGNRFFYGQAWNMIPKVRYLGNSVLSLFTKISSGYWHIADSQTGYTAVSTESLQKIRLSRLYPRYGFPNDMLIHLNIVHARVKEIPIKPIYHAGGKSGIRLWKVIPTISWLLIKRFFWRLTVKYIVEDFHPMVFFYMASFFLNLASIYLLIRLIMLWQVNLRIPPTNALALFFCVIMSTQFLFFAMWFDMDYNKDLKVK